MIPTSILNAHGTNASPDGLCTRTHTNEAFSCWFRCNSLSVDRARRGNVCYQAKACSPTDQPVRKFKDGLGIDMTMKTFVPLHITSCEKHSMVVYIYEPYPWAQSVVDCDASVMVVDCVAVKTGCMLEKYIPAKGCNKYVFLFIFWSRCCCCCCCVLLLLRAAAAAHISTEAEVFLFRFLWLRCCCSSLIESDVLKKIRLVSAFSLIRVRNQWRSV